MASFKDFNKVRGGGLMTAADYNRLLDTVESSRNVSSADGAWYHVDAGVAFVQREPPYLVALITGNDAGTPAHYSWAEYNLTDTGLVLRPDGLSSDGVDQWAQEVNDNPVPTGAYVLLWQALGELNWWVFWPVGKFDLTYVGNVTYETGTVTYQNDTVTYGTVSNPTNVNVNNGVFVFPATSNVAVAPAAQLVIPQLTVSGPPTYTPTQAGAILCGTDAIYQYTAGAWQPYVPWKLATFPVADAQIPFVDSKTLTSSSTFTFTPATSQLAVGAAPVAASQVSVHTTADTNVGLTVRGNSLTQTANLVNVQTSAGTNLLNVTKNGALQVTPNADVTALSLTTASNPANPALKITATGTPTGDVFEIVTGTSATAIAVNKDYYLKFPTTASTSTAPVANLSLPTLTVTGAPTWTPPSGDYPLVLNSADSLLYGWNGSAWFTATGGSGTPGGSNGELQWNNSGAFDGVPIASWTGSTVLFTNGTSIVHIHGSGAIDAFGTIGFVRICDESSDALVYADDGTRLVKLCDGINALQAKGDVLLCDGAGDLSFFTHSLAAQQTVSGTVTAGTLSQLQTAVKALLTALAAYGLIVDNTT